MMDCPETSGNLRKPPETSGNLRKPPETSGNLRKPPETSGNLRKPPETGNGGFRQVSGKQTKLLVIPALFDYMVKSTRAGITRDFVYL
jgi:hypothetical protein